MAKFSTMILAAGKGVRMKSDLPKVLHVVGGRPMILFSVNLSVAVGSERTVLVVGREHDQLKNTVQSHFLPKTDIEFAIQAEQLGTGHAVLCALESTKIKSGALLVLSADMPLITAATIEKLWQTHQKNKSVLSLLTAHKRDSQGFGRIVRDSRKKIRRIVEERDANAEEKAITEVNLAIYLFDLKFLNAEVKKLRRNNKQREYYLPDLVERAVQKRLPVSVCVVDEGPDSLGINSPGDLVLANDIFYSGQRQHLRGSGVILLGDQIFVDAGVTVQPGVRLESSCYLKGKTRVAQNVVVESGCVVKDSVLHDGAHLKSFCYVDEAEVGQKTEVGPFAHLRPKTVLADHVKIGNFVETKKTTIGAGSKVNHLTYLGDATVGKNVNVGAGTITCNYDGVGKYQTILEDAVFIGSDTQLVAPVTVGKGAYVGAGTTVTQDVAAGSLVISRVPQKEIPGWAERKKKLATNR